MKAIVFDLEIKRAILSRGEQVREGILYCEGFHDHKSMGISVLGLYDYEQNRARVFCDDNKGEFAITYHQHLFCGFNSRRFDAKVMAEAWNFFVPEAMHYDILEELWRAHGLDPNAFNWRTHGGFSLGAVFKANFPELKGKMDKGAEAPIHWQRGRIGEVIDYCLHDVYLTQLLFERILAKGGLISPKTKVLVALPNPLDLLPKTLDFDEVAS